jgi:hypothetical protein
MLSTRLRTTIIALVASLSFTAASVVPSISQASKNTGAYSKSSEAKKAQEQAWLCHQMLGMMNEDLQALGNAHAAEDQAAINDAREKVNGDYLMGYENGCAWASRLQPPESPTSGLVPPVEAIKASPEGTLPPVQGVQPASPAPAL